MPLLPRSEGPREETYTADLKSIIDNIGLGFHGDIERQSPAGTPDLIIFYKGKPVAVIEVKRPENTPTLADPNLRSQALRYAEWYRLHRNVEFYGIHNVRYLELYKYSPPTERQTSLLEFISPSSPWISVTGGIPFEILPNVKELREYSGKLDTLRSNVERFLLWFKELLEGKSLDISREVISEVSRLIIEASSAGVEQLFHNYYRKGKLDIFEEWLSERNIRRPRNDSEARKYLKSFVTEQIYTFAMKLIFYQVLQSIDVELSKKLQESLSSLRLVDPVLFKKVTEAIFKYAIERTGDFEEVFASNLVDRAPYTDGEIPILHMLLDYLSQIRWSELSIDVIGRIFECLIHEERRHLLGQHFTDPKVVDLIVSLTASHIGRVLDPACGSGTFLVRLRNFWKTFYPEADVSSFLYGIDIDKLASMLTIINLYIQELEKIKKGEGYIPKVLHSDFFAIQPGMYIEKFGEKFENFHYIVTNPPYTRQEEMLIAYYNPNYKDTLKSITEDIRGWSKRASIYAYFIVRSGHLLKQGGRLGYIIENSWLNADYGTGLKRYLLDNFKMEYIIESQVERWFEDADVVTNIIIAQKKSPGDKDEEPVYFISLKKRLKDLFGNPPPACDYTANRNYYDQIKQIITHVKRVRPREVRTRVGTIGLYEDENLKAVRISQNTLKPEEKWGIYRAPIKYLKILGRPYITRLSQILHIRRGLTTNANEIFYLPSKHWKYHDEDENYLHLISGLEILRLSKKYLKPLMRLEHIAQVNRYWINTHPQLPRENYVLWVEEESQVKDEGIRRYIEWIRQLVNQAYQESNGRKFPTIKRKMEKCCLKWLKLSAPEKAEFLLRSAIHTNFSVFYNTVDAIIDKRLYYAYRTLNASTEVYFAILNSIVTYIGIETSGGYNLGQGALDVKVIDYQSVFTLNPAVIENLLTRSGRLDLLKQAVNVVMSREPKPIMEEATMEDRLRMEEILLGVLGFRERDIEELYDELVKLVELRIERAKVTPTR